jgi:hypothetical protein
VGFGGPSDEEALGTFQEAPGMITFIETETNQKGPFPTCSVRRGLPGHPQGPFSRRRVRNPGRGYQPAAAGLGATRILIGLALAAG